jgi:1-phosphofructokinase family hexose kinase
MAAHIVCISANPALERRLRLPTLKLGEVNRATSTESFGGGKAAHVAMAAQALSSGVSWIGFLGGSSGEECAAKLRGLGFEVFPVSSESSTRLNLEILHGEHEVTEILEPGGPPGRAAMDEMTRTLIEGLKTKWKGAPVSISGSMPAGMPRDFVASLIRAAQSQHSAVFLDTSGDALPASLSAQPTLVKINRSEAQVFLHSQISTPADAVNAAREIIDLGAQSAAITLGADGIVWLEKRAGPAWLSKPPKIKPISTVGSGDTTLAGFIVASQRRLTGGTAIRFATACGAANCLAPIPGAIQHKDVDALLSEVKVIAIA